MKAVRAIDLLPVTSLILLSSQVLYLRSKVSKVWLLLIS